MRFPRRAMGPYGSIRYYPRFPEAVPERGAGCPRVTQPFATLSAPEGALTVRLACVRRAASVHPEPGSNSPFGGGRPEGAAPSAEFTGTEGPGRPGDRSRSVLWIHSERNRVFPVTYVQARSDHRLSVSSRSLDRSIRFSRSPLGACAGDLDPLVGAARGVNLRPSPGRVQGRARSPQGLHILPAAAYMPTAVLMPWRRPYSFGRHIRPSIVFRRAASIASTSSAADRAAPYRIGRAGRNGTFAHLSPYRRKAPPNVWRGLTCLIWFYL